MIMIATTWHFLINVYTDMWGTKRGYVPQDMWGTKCVMCHIAHFCTNNNAHSTVLLSIFWTSIHSPFIHYNNLLFMLKQELWFFLHSIKHLFLFLFIWKTQFSTKLQIAPFCTEPSIWPCMSCRIMW